MAISSLVKNLSVATVGAMAMNLVAFHQASASPLINGEAKKYCLSIIDGNKLKVPNEDFTYDRFWK